MVEYKGNQNKFIFEFLHNKNKSAVTRPIEYLILLTAVWKIIYILEVRCTKISALGGGGGVPQSSLLCPLTIWDPSGDVHLLA